MEVDVVLFHRLSAIVEFFVFLSLFGSKLMRCKCFYRFFVGQDAHAAVGKLPEGHQPEKPDHTSGKEHEADVAFQDDTSEAMLFKLDIT